MRRQSNIPDGMTRKQRFLSCFLALTAISLAMLGIIHAQQDGPVGTVRQPLVGGQLVADSTQEEFGLLNLSDSCSASLCRNGWVITAAHCVETGGGNKTQMPDPSRPGQNVLNPIAGITLKANWTEKQERKAVQVVTFRPYDVAIIQVDAPFKVHGRTTGYSRLIFQDGQFPYFGEPVGANIILFGRGISVFAKDASTPSVRDGLYRVAYAKPTRDDANSYWFPSTNGQMVAGGDSGGPSFAWTLNGYALVGVHSAAKSTYVPGQPTTGWNWVTSTSEAADAPVAPVLANILAVMGPNPPGDLEPALEPPPPGFIGTFAKTPPDFQPIWLYGIRPNGELIWYRKDTGATAWQGPQKVADGWSQYKDVTAAGGNRFYALTNDGKILWFQHNGFNDGSFSWAGPRSVRSGKETLIDLPVRSVKMMVKGSEVGTGWTFKRIFSGGEGILYAIRQDGRLLWYRHTGFNDGTRIWADAKEIGSGWGDLKDVFCTGQGKVYAVTQDGRLMVYQQKDYANGVKDWYPARQVGTGWGDFQQIIPAGDGVILAITHAGKLLWYRNYYQTPAVRLGRVKEVFEGPVEIGSGWQDFSKVVALIPLPTPPPVR